MNTTDVPQLRGDVMPESKAQPKVKDPESEVQDPAPTGLTPAGESSNPAVQQLLAELQTLRANGAEDDAQDVVTYLAELGYSA
jgi:hypothetical protein